VPSVLTRSLEPLAMNTDPIFSVRAARLSPSIYVEASRFVRKMSGGAQGHLIESANGDTYVVKFTNNPQHLRIVINEWITSTIFRHLCISTPDAAVVNISREFIRDNPGVYMELHSRRVLPTFGSHFGSRFAGESGQIRVYSHLPNATLESVANLSDFCGVFVADKWLGNTDYRQAIFTRTPGVCHPFSFVVQMIDNGQMFDGGNWRFEDSPIRRPYYGSVFQHVNGIAAFEPWLAAVASFPQSVLEDAFQEMPPSWRSGDTEAAFEKLLGLLMRRRERVTDWIHECHARSSNPFPNWA
jgi:hypothetical protein